MSKVLYRAVKANDSNDVIAIGYDENQGNQDYNGIGVWCDFTFEEIPSCPQEIRQLLRNISESRICLLKVEDGTITVKSVEEIQAELEAQETDTESDDTTASE